MVSKTASQGEQDQHREQPAVGKKSRQDKGEQEGQQGRHAEQEGGGSSEDIDLQQKKSHKKIKGTGRTK
jgi:hypothetical protein